MVPGLRTKHHFVYSLNQILTDLIFFAYVIKTVSFFCR